MALIPFGLKDGRLVDITGVERGLRCGCICPSCGQRLVARFGSVTIPHFAHDKDADAQGVNKDPCQLSFWVALRLMIKQVVNEQGFLRIRIPSLIIEHVGRDDAYRPVVKSMQVSKEQEITLTEVEYQAVVSDTTLDLVGKIGNALLGIHFIYPGRQRCQGDFKTRIGVIEINLTELEWIYENYDFVESEPFDRRVLTYLNGSIEAKRWYFHPSYDQAKSMLEEQVQAQVTIQNIQNVEEQRKKAREQHLQQQQINLQQDQRRSKLEQLSKNGDWHCVRCNCAWILAEKGSTCPNCYMPGAKIIIR